jgi:branched-chain amino acid transport system permease protein
MNSEHVPPSCLFVAVAFAALALAARWWRAFGVDLVTKIMVYAIFALSLELLVGSTGLVCFGQAAFFGIGAYATVLLSPERRSPAALLWLLPACVAAAALYALAVGALSPAHQGRVLHHGHAGLRADGLLRGARHPAGRRHRRHLPERQARCWALLDLDKPLVLYYFTLGLLAAVFGFLALLLRSRFGRALAGIRVNEQRMRATGFSTYPYKLAAFTSVGRAWPGWRASCSR